MLGRRLQPRVELVDREVHVVPHLLITKVDGERDHPPRVALWHRQVGRRVVDNRRTTRPDGCRLADTGTHIRHCWLGDGTKGGRSRQHCVGIVGMHVHARQRRVADDNDGVAPRASRCTHRLDIGTA